MRRLLVFIAIVTTASVITPLPATAHGTLTSGNPGPGAKVGKGVVVIGLTFEDIKEDGPASVSVENPQNTTLHVGKPVPAGNNTICLTVEPLINPGIYVISYEITASDEHLETGKFQFEVIDSIGRPAEPIECSELDLPAPSISNTQKFPAIYAIGLVVIIAAIVAGLARVGKRKSFR